METKNKIVKTAKVCYIVSKVIYCLSFAACLTFIVLAIALPLSNAVKSFTKAETATIFSTLALYAFMCIGLLWNVEGLFKSVVQNQTPFSEAVNHYLKKIAIFILLVSLIPAIVGSTVLRIACPETELTFPVAMGGVVGGIVLFLIGMFFKYGNELQKQDDETL
ncbi:MAG: DUF2975 domain-containing protein [Clostridiales bacterium]|nr:DUF2975 domain-containing protein [Clostridiales bacterium]